MVTVTYQGKTCEPRAGETLLDAFLRQGIVAPFSCRAGICHTCLMRRVDDGRIPEAAQRGLTPEQKKLRYLLPCRCIPEEDMLLDPLSRKTAFETAPDRPNPEFTEEPRREPTPDPQMWAALREGELLQEILTDFYTRVYDDPLLAPFFTHTTRQRAIEKQFNFLNQIFTGEDVYFGERPRNAHHWMVISDEMFDYREKLMRQVQREHGLPEHLIRRWSAMEESYREVIVKDHAWPKIIHGSALPLEGYEPLRLEFSSLCDGCSAEVAVNDMVQFHVRLGTAYCVQCATTLQATTNY